MWPFAQATDTEEKRDKYKSLYDKLENYYNDYNNKKSELEAHKKNYDNARCSDNKDCITTSKYDQKEDICSSELDRVIKTLTDKASIIDGLKTNAKTKYDYYKNKAIQESADS